MRGFVALAVVSTAACVSTRFDEGQLLCRTSDATPCPVGLICARDGRCRASDLVASAGSVTGAGGAAGVGGAGGGSACQPKVCGPSGLCGMGLDDGCGKSISCGCKGGVSCVGNSCSCAPEPAHAAAKGSDFAVNSAEWLSPANILANDDNRAIATLAGGKTTHRLLAQTFKLALGSPSGSDGVHVDAIHAYYYRSSAGSGTVHDAAVLLIDDKGALKGSDQATQDPWPVGTDAKVEYVWKVPADVALGAAELRSANFGVMLEARNDSSASGSARVDYVAMSVDFHCDLGSVPLP